MKPHAWIIASIVLFLSTLAVAQGSQTEPAANQNVLEDSPEERPVSETAPPTALPPLAGAPDTNAIADETNDRRNEEANTEVHEPGLLGDGWAEWSGVLLSFFALLVSYRAVTLLKETLSATREAVRSADDAVEATRDIGTKQLRPWLIGTHAEFGLFNSGVMYELQFSCSWTNSGQSPAVNCRSFSDYKVLKKNDPIPTFSAGVNKQYPNMGVIGPRVDNQNSDQFAIAGPDLHNFLHGQSVIYLYARFEYRDPFDATKEYLSSVMFRCVFQGTPGMSPQQVSEHIMVFPVGEQNMLT